MAVLAEFPISCQGRGPKSKTQGGVENGSGVRGERQPTRVVCSFCAIIAAVPPRPQDGTVSVIVLFTIVFGCVTD